MLDSQRIQSGIKGYCITIHWGILIIILPTEKKSLEASKSLCMKIGQTVEDKTLLSHVSKKICSFIYLKLKVFF